MLTYVIELHCDTPGCGNFLAGNDGPAVFPRKEAYRLMAKAESEGWDASETHTVCPKCRKSASGQEQTKQ